MYEYKAKILKIVDGDTMDVEIDLGFNMHANMRLRLSGLDTEDLNDSNLQKRSMAKDAKARVEELVSQKGKDFVVVRTIKDRKEKFGRYLATIVFQDNTNLNETLLSEGLAKPYGES